MFSVSSLTCSLWVRKQSSGVMPVGEGQRGDLQIGQGIHPSVILARGLQGEQNKL